MNYLILANLMLLLAPLLYLLALQFRRIWSGVVRALMLAVTMIVVVHLLPESYEVIGWSALLVLIAGALLPSAIERIFRNSMASVHEVSRMAVFIGVALHTMVDGAALAIPEASHHGLSLAVVLHRIPDGVVIWGTFFPHLRLRKSLLLLFILIGATVAGFFLSEYLVGIFGDEGSALPILQALIAGTLLHVIFHNESGHSAEHGHHHGHSHGHHQVPSHQHSHEGNCQHHPGSK